MYLINNNFIIISIMIKINFFIMYEIIKDYVAQSLKLNGFRVKKDFRFPLSV